MPKQDKYAKAIAKLGRQIDIRRSIGATRDAVKDVRRGGHIKDLNGTVHN